MASCQQVFHISNKLLSRAITACLPASNLQTVQQIAVTVRNKSQALHSPLVLITGKLCYLIGMPNTDRYALWVGKFKFVAVASDIQLHLLSLCLQFQTLGQLCQMISRYSC